MPAFKHGSGLHCVKHLCNLKWSSSLLAIDMNNNIASRGKKVQIMIFCVNFDWFSGGWHGRGMFKVTFNSGGAIEFAENFKRAVARGKWRLMTI